MATLPNGAVVPHTGNMATLPNGAVVPAVAASGPSGPLAVVGSAVVPGSGYSGAVVASAGPLVTLSNGAQVPADTPAVAAAKANFAAAGGITNPAVGGFAVAGPSYSGPVAAPGPLVTHSNGAVTPADTPAVAAAKAAFGAAGGYTNPAIGGSGAYAGPTYPAPAGVPYSGPLAAAGPLVTHSNGAVTPADTPAVAAAKAAFRAAGGEINPAAVGQVGAAAA